MSADLSFSPIAYPSLRAGAFEDEIELARTKGHAAGYAAGLRLAAADATRAEERAAAEVASQLESSRIAVLVALRALDAAAELFATLSLPVLEEADATLAEASIELAGAIAGWRPEDAETAAAAAVRRAIAGAGATEILAVRLNPTDFELIGADAAELASVTVIADPSIGRGDALVDLADGRVDARIASAFERARAALMGEES
jgi:flagellar assembly protein FliH